VRLHDREGNAGDVGLVLDEGPKLKEAPARVVPADRRFDLDSIQEYIAIVYIITKKGALCSYG
jgi:hypothetical protein